MSVYKPTVVLVWLAFLVSTGCYEDRPVKGYEAGVYKGKPDDLLKKQSASQAEQLRNRFKMVQSDR